MPDQPPTRRRFQFGLRKLLLWTGVVAVLLGMAASLGDGGWFLACGILVISVVRVAFGTKAAGILSVTAAAILLASFSWAVAVSFDPGPDLGEVIVSGLIFGGLFGFVMFGIVEGVVRAVNWADKVLETKSDGETSRD